jgi:hypothetical protein
MTSEQAGSPNAKLITYLAGRYRPAYRAASNMQVGGVILTLLGVVIGAWSTMWFFSGYLRKEAAAPVIFLVGFAALAVGLNLIAIAAILRANIDRTCFLAPGLDAHERVMLVVEAAGARNPFQQRRDRKRRQREDG